eukprot:218559_1
MTKKSFCNVPEWNALMLSMSFYFLFGAFNTLQSYATSYYPTVGSVSYGIVYLTSPFASPFAPLIINKLDFKYSLLLAFVIYSTYNASYFIENNIFYLIMSFLCGFIAPTMWTCQGAYLTQCCNVYEYQHKIKYNSQIGWFKGLFYSLFACHTTSGYLFAALYFQFNDSNHTFFFICTLISFGAIIFILLFRYMPQQKYIQSIDINKNEQNDLQNNLVSEQNSINNPENIQQNKKDNMLFPIDVIDIIHHFYKVVLITQIAVDSYHKIYKCNTYEYYIDLNKVILFQQRCILCHKYYLVDKIFFWPDCDHAFCSQCILSHLNTIEGTIETNKIPICVVNDCKSELSKKSLESIYKFSVDVDKNWVRVYHATSLDIMHKKKTCFECKLCTNWHQKEDLFLLGCGCTVTTNCIYKQGYRINYINNIPWQWPS